MDFPAISDRLKMLLDKNNITAYRLCKACGIPQSSFSKMISNKWEWKLSYIARMAKYFHVTIDYLVFGNMDEVYRNLVSAYNTLSLEVYNFHEELEKLNTLRDIVIEKMTLQKPKLKQLSITSLKSPRKKSRKD